MKFHRQTGPDFTPKLKSRLGPPRRVKWLVRRPLTLPLWAVDVFAFDFMPLMPFVIITSNVWTFSFLRYSVWSHYYPLNSMPYSDRNITTFPYKAEMLSACIECSNGIFTENGCGGTNTISRETGILPPFFTLRMLLYSTQSFSRGTAPYIFSLD